GDRPPRHRVDGLAPHPPRRGERRVPRHGGGRGHPQRHHLNIRAYRSIHHRKSASRAVRGARVAGLMGLSARGRALLDFDRDWGGRPGRKEAAIRTGLGVPATRYYEILRHLVDVPEAYDYDPLTVKRVRRERDRRRRERLEGRRADPGTR